MADRSDTPAAKAEDDKVKAAREAGEPKGRAMDRPEQDQIAEDVDNANLADKKVAAEAEAYDEANSPSHGEDVEVPEGDPRMLRQLPHPDEPGGLTPDEKARLAELRAKTPSAHAKERTDDEESEYRRLMDREHDNPPPDVAGA